MTNFLTNPVIFTPPPIIPGAIVIGGTMPAAASIMWQPSVMQPTQINPSPDAPLLSAVDAYVEGVASLITQPSLKEILEFGTHSLILPNQSDEDDVLVLPDGETVAMSASAQPYLLNSPAFTNFMAGSKQGKIGGDGSGVSNRGGGAPAVPPPAGGGGKEKVDSESVFRLLSQGVPQIPAFMADYIRSRGIATSLYLGGTYRDDPVGTENPDSVMSIPMHYLVGDKYWEKELTTEIRQEMDYDSAAYQQGYTWGKLIRYVASLGGNVASMQAIINDTSKTPRERNLLLDLAYYDFMGNAAFLAEKICYGLCLPLVGGAAVMGRGSMAAEAMYLGGAGIVNLALFLATVAWYGKVKYSLRRLNEERARFVQDPNYQIHFADVNQSVFNIANAVARWPKHFTGHITTALLGLYMYSPQTFSFLGETEYVKEATKKLGEGTSAESLYRWSNFSFIVPKPIVLFGLSFAVFASLLNISLNLSSATHTLRRHLAYQRRQDGKFDSELLNLIFDETANVIGIGASFFLLGTSVTIYPATEPHALVFTSAMGLALFMQYTIKERKTIWMALRALRRMSPAGVWNVIKTRGKNNGTIAEKKGNFFVRMVRAVGDSRKAMKLEKVREKEQYKDLSIKDGFLLRMHNARVAMDEWGGFFSAYLGRGKIGKGIVKFVSYPFKAIRGLFGK